MVGSRPKRPAGRSVQVVRTDNQELKNELATLKAELLAQLAAILGEVKAAQILNIDLPAATQQPIDDVPVFIPNKITPDANAEINIQATESKGDSLDDAVAALKKAKKKKENKE